LKGKENFSELNRIIKSVVFLLFLIVESFLMDLVLDQENHQWLIYHIIIHIHLKDSKEKY
jgi:hypothetical protein